MIVKCFIRGPMVMLLCCCLTMVYAQDGALTYGAKVGSTFTYFTNDFKLEGGNPGLQVGGIVNYDLSGLMQVTGDLGYTQLRGVIKGNPQIVSGYNVVKDNNLTIHALEANGLFGYKLPLPFLGEAAPYIQGGASIAYNMGTWNKYSARYVPGTSGEPIEVTGKENTGGVVDDFIASWMIGLRFESTLDGGLFSKMIIDLRLKNSMTPAVNPYSFTGSTNELGIRSASVALGFMF